MMILIGGGDTTTAASIGIRPTEEDARIIEAATREGESTSDVIRGAVYRVDLGYAKRGHEQRGR
jgi:hypothetical protein